MKIVLLYVMVIFLASCQKELSQPQQVKEQPAEIAVPDPEPTPEPQPELEPESEPVRLRNFANHFTADNHYKLVKAYTDDADIWDSIPSWAKDDIHTLKEFGDGTIVSSDECPKHPFEVLEQSWSAYGDDIGVRLTWVDLDYNAVTYVVKSMNVGKSFTVYEIKDNKNIYLQFALAEIK